jgi:hypothetical protein
MRTKRLLRTIFITGSLILLCLGCKQSEEQDKDNPSKVDTIDSRIHEKNNFVKEDTTASIRAEEKRNMFVEELSDSLVAFTLRFWNSPVSSYMYVFLDASDAKALGFNVERYANDFKTDADEFLEKVSLKNKDLIGVQKQLSKISLNPDIQPNVNKFIWATFQNVTFVSYYNIFPGTSKEDVMVERNKKVKIDKVYGSSQFLLLTKFRAMEKLTYSVRSDTNWIWDPIIDLR